MFSVRCRSASRSFSGRSLVWVAVIALAIVVSVASASTFRSPIRANHVSGASSSSDSQWAKDFVRNTIGLGAERHGAGLWASDLFSMLSTAEDSTSADPVAWFTGLLKKVESVLEPLIPTLRDRGHFSASTYRNGQSSPFGSTPQPAGGHYLEFIPEFLGSALVNGEVLSSQPTCFRNTTFVVRSDARLLSGDLSESDKLQILKENGLTIEIIASDPSSELCCDHYMLATVEDAHVHSICESGSHEVKWSLNEVPSGKKAPVTSLDLLWILHRGLYVFRFPIHSTGDLLASLWDSLALFVPALTGGPGVPSFTAARNAKFLEDYADYVLEKRASSSPLDIDETLIQTGDFVAVMRLDGLDPVEAFGMGSHTGHTATTVWIDGELYVIESTAKSNYWPKDNIQRNKWKDWIQMAQDANYNVVWVPMKAEVRARMNTTAAIEWFETVAEGVPYGFHNYLFCWIDTVSDNFPLTLSAELLEVLFALLDRRYPVIADRMWNQAFSKRLNSATILNTTQVYEILIRLESGFEHLKSQMSGNGNGALRDAWATRFHEVVGARQHQTFAPDLSGENLSPSSSPILFSALAESDLSVSLFPSFLTIPEQDAWRYTDGPSMVCDVLVCSFYKAGGLFGDLSDEIQCTEFQNWDVYSLNFFDLDFKRPEICEQADPGMPFCQIMGEYRLVLSGAGTKAPYPHMTEKCPGLPPKYEKPADC